MGQEMFVDNADGCQVTAPVLGRAQDPPPKGALHHVHVPYVRHVRAT